MWMENFQMFKLDLEKAEEPRSNCQHLLDHRKSKRIPEKISTSASLSALKPLTVWSQQTVENSSRDGNTRPLTCLLKNQYADQEATVITRHGTTDWFQIGKGVCQSCILSPYLFNLYAEYIMWNARLDDAQAWIKTAKRSTLHIG